MAYRFYFLDDIALADLAFDTTADSPGELVEGATRALIETMADPLTVGRAWYYEIDHYGDDLSTLLFDWLEEMVYLKDAHGVVFHDVSLHLDQPALDAGWHLHGHLVGAPVDPSRQDLRSDVKGVTKHLYIVTQTNTGWRARVVLDV